MSTKKGFRDPMEFVRAGNDNPPSTEQGGSPVAHAAADPEPKPAPPEKAPARQKAAKPAESFPWNDAHPKLKEQFTMRLPQALHMKLKYVAEHSPESMHDIALAAVSAAVEKRLREMDIKG